MAREKCHCLTIAFEEDRTVGKLKAVLPALSQWNLTHRFFFERKYREHLKIRQ